MNIDKRLRRQFHYNASSPAARQFIVGERKIVDVISVGIVTLNGTIISENIVNPSQLVWFLIQIEIDNNNIKIMPADYNSRAYGFWEKFDTPCDTEKVRIITQLNKYWYPVYGWSIKRSYLDSVNWDKISLTAGDKEYMGSRVKDFIKL